MRSGYIWIDNVGGDAYINRRVFLTRAAAEESLDAWMTHQYEGGITLHADGFYYDMNGDMAQAYVQEIDLPE